MAKDTERTCSVEGCATVVRARGWCDKHYNRWRKHGDPLVGGPKLRRTGPGFSCAIDGCELPVLNRRTGWCSKHYTRFVRYGDPHFRKRIHKYGGKHCSIDGCSEPAIARGWCMRHWQCWQRNGDPTGFVNMPIKTLADFEKREMPGDVPSHRPDIGACVLWTGAIHHIGYGVVRYGGRQWQAHRLKYVLTHGEILPGIQVNHRCDNRACVRIDHLKLGTCKENLQDAVRRGRLRRGKRGRILPLP